MKKVLIGFAMITGAAVSAQAADMAVQAPLYKAPPILAYNWTGFYAGINAGGSIGRNLTRTSASAGGLVILNESSHLSPAGAIGGGQVGYNWQFPGFFNLVLGVEADIQASGQSDSFTCRLNCLPGSSLRLDQELDWFGTVRGRAGIATGPVLSYVTAGYAYGHLNTTVSGDLGGPFSLAIDETKGGYVLGSGVEASLGGNWTGKLEYLYLDLGTIDGAFAAPGFAGVGSTRIRDHIFRGGLNYRFGGNNTFAEPLANWAGFYIGGNFGSLYGRNESELAFAGGVGAPSFTMVPDGITGGGQIGYNWQAGAWVFGVEADFQGSTAKDDKACVFFCVSGLAVVPEQKLTYFGTVRGRIGYSVGATLFYGTGGYAYGEAKTSITELIAPTVAAVELKHAKGGYTVGAGIESSFNPLNLFGPNWTSKSEYLYINLGRSTETLTAGPLVGQTFSTKIEEHVFRTGINYHFHPVAAARY
jgi:outer membrane immunogenic protein